MDKKSSIKYTYVIVLIGAIGFLLYYIRLSVGPVPLMDFWKGSADYLEHIVSEHISLKDVFLIPHALHHNPLFNFCNYIFVRYFRCDNYAYIYSGLLFAIFVIVLVIQIYSHNKVNNPFLGVVGCFIVILPIINLNQWEIITIFCYFPFMVRIFCYLLSFEVLSNLLKLKDNRFKSILCFSVWLFVVVMCVSQAYFVGYVSAIMGIIIVDIVLNKINKSKVIWLVVCISSVFFYLVTLNFNDVAFHKTSNPFIVSDFIKGILVMLASTLLPQRILSENIQLALGVGVLIFILACFSVFLFFKKKMWVQTYFPLACLIYAFVSIVVIVIGRVRSFGVTSLISSRYVVETTIGLLGMLLIFWKYLIEEIKWKKRIISIIVVVSVSGALLYSNFNELKIAPYRKEYNLKMEQILLDIDNVSDEDLVIFQAPAEQVRAGAAVMKKYKLGVYQ